jgi:hypothetical protein
MLLVQEGHFMLTKDRVDRGEQSVQLLNTQPKKDLENKPQ